MEGVILSFAYLSENGKFFVLYYKFMHETKKKANGHRFRQGMYIIKYNKKGCKTRGWQRSRSLSGHDQSKASDRPNFKQSSERSS